MWFIIKFKLILLMVVILLLTIYPEKCALMKYTTKCIKVWYKIIFMVIGQQKIIKIFTKSIYSY